MYVDLSFECICENMLHIRMQQFHNELCLTTDKWKSVLQTHVIASTGGLINILGN